MIAEQIAVGKPGQAIVESEPVNFGIGLRFGAAHGRTLQLALHRRKQPGEIALVYRVLRAAVHRGHCDVLADFS